MTPLLRGWPTEFWWYTSWEDLIRRHMKSLTSSAPLLCDFVYREFLVLSCHFTTLLWYPTHTHPGTGTFPFLYTLYSGVLFTTRRRPGCLWFQHQSFGMGGDLGRIGTLDCCFYTREQISPKLAQSLHLHHLGKKKKKRIYSGFVGCFSWLPRLHRCFLDWTMLTRTRNGYKNISYSGLCTTKGGTPRERKALIPYSAYCVCVQPWLVLRITFPPFGCFWFASRLIPRTTSCFFGPAFHAVFFLFAGGDGMFWEDPSCMVLLGAASRRWEWSYDLDDY